MKRVRIPGLPVITWIAIAMGIDTLLAVGILEIVR